MTDAAALWSGGDYARVQDRLQPASDLLVDAVGITEGDRVLDVAAGTGNAAIAAARAGARVVATDIARAMVDAGRHRTEGLPIDWLQADAMDLPFADGSFDKSISVFGAIFAPDQERAAAELLRVTKPGGTVGITAWAADAAFGALVEVIGRHLPESPPSVPDRWSDPAAVVELLPGAAVEHVTLTWRFATAEAFIAWYGEAPPPVAAARRAMGPERWTQAAAQMLEALHAHGERTDDGFVVRPAYLVVTATA